MNDQLLARKNSLNLYEAGGAIIFLFRLLVVCATFLLNAGLSAEWFSISKGLVLYTLLLLCYLSIESKLLYQTRPLLFWIQPPLLASIFVFAIPFSVANLIYFFPEDDLTLAGLSPIATPWMNQLMMLVVLGAVAMWMGYRSALGWRGALVLRQSRILRKCISTSTGINLNVVYLFLFVSVLAKLWAISLGIFGYASTYERLIEAANYTQYFAWADSLGKIALVAVAFRAFISNTVGKSERSLLWLIAGIEILFGFLSGFKSAVVMPLIIVGIVYYSQRNRIPTKLIAAAFLALVIAYAVVEPYRATHNENAGAGSVSILGIIATIVDARSSSVDDLEQRASILLNIASRSTMTHIGSLGLEYAADRDVLPAGSPDFLGDIFLSPLHALVPRFLWEDKPLQNIGLWYTQEVMGLNHFSSTAMSTFTYLNFAGGTFAVIFGYFIVGFFQRVLFDGIFYFGGGGGLIVFLGLLPTLVNMDSAFNSIFINIIRFFPLLILVQYMLVRKVNRLCVE